MYDFKNKRKERNKARALRAVICSKTFLSLLVFLFLFNFILASSQFGYNNLDKPTLSKTIVNYTQVNVNSSKFWDTINLGALSSTLQITENAMWTRTGTDVHLTNSGDNVGIGTTSSTTKLHVNGSINATETVYGTSTDSYGVSGTSTDSYGVVGISTDSYGVVGASINSIGVYGASTDNYAVRGLSTNNYGVYGESINNYGVYGESANSYGVLGTSENNHSGYFKRNTGTPTSDVPVMYVLQDHASDNNSAMDVRQDGAGAIQRWFDNTTEVARIDDGGNVGIGTTTPDTKLDVNGDMSGARLSLGTATAWNAIEVKGTGKNFARFYNNNNVANFLVGSSDAAYFTSWYQTCHFSTRGGAYSIYFRPNNTISLELSTLATIFNEYGNDIDVRMEGTSDPNLFYLDAGNNKIGIGTNSPSYPLHVNNHSMGGISIYAQQNISATGYITRTSVFDKDNNVWDFIKDADYYKDESGKVEHNKFYGYTTYPKSDVSKPVVVNNITTYPFNITEEGVSLEAEINVLRQAVYELNERVKVLETECVRK
jgi:hypothetical protein